MISEPVLEPSNLNWTPATPTLSVALAETVTEDPETVAPLDGAVRETDGGVVSVEEGGVPPDENAPISGPTPVYG